MAWLSSTVQLPWLGLIEAGPDHGGGAITGSCGLVEATPHALAGLYQARQCLAETPFQHCGGEGKEGEKPLPALKELPSLGEGRGKSPL